MEKTRSLIDSGIRLTPTRMVRRGNTAGRTFTTKWTLITIYAASVMLAFINGRSVWVDEAISVSIASESFKTMAHTLQHVDAVHALYYSLLHIWLHVGHSAIVIRLLSVVFAVSASAAIGTAAVLLFDEDAALGVIALLATSQFFLFYADEARSITLSLMTCSLAALNLWRVVKHERPRDIAICAVFAVIAIYANFVAVLFVAGLAASLAFARLSRNTVFLLSGAAAAVGVAVIPLGLLIHRNSLVQIGWIPHNKPTIVFHVVSGVLGGSVGSGSTSHMFGLVGAACVFLLMVVGIAGGWRLREYRPGVVVTATWFVVPIVLGVAVDQLVQPILIVRYFSFLLIPIALLSGYGLAIVRRHVQPLLAYGIVAALAVISIHSLLTVQREDWRSASQFLSQRASRGDGIVFWAPTAIVPFKYAALETSTLPAAQIVYPSGPLIDAVEYPRPSAEFAQTVSGRFKRVWLVESHSPTLRGQVDPFDALSRYYSHTHRQIFNGVQVTMYSR
jgi:mannosyltransferase